MKSRFTLLLVLVFTGNIIMAQDYVFKVLANKGGNTLKAAQAKSEWEPIKTGTALFDDDELKISQNAYLGLVHVSGKTMELTDEGSYNVKELATRLGNTRSSVASKYANFVINKMTEEDAADINKDHRRYLTVTGAVERGILDAPISLMMPSSAEILNAKALIRWEEVEGAKAYVFTAKNVYDEVIDTYETETPEVQLNLDDTKFKGQELIIVRVQVKGDDQMYSGNYGIKRLSAVKADPINMELDQLKLSLDGETALNQLILATFYEENNLLIDAISSYEKALSLSPGVDQFQIAYAMFKKRNNI